MAIWYWYNQVVHWHRNIFKIPAGKAGKTVVKELTRLFEAYADATTLESVAITAAMVLPSLILQKPHRSSKGKEHVKCIERRMKLWQEGNLDDLLKEGQTIQQRLKHSTRDKRSEEQLARSFSKLMMEGKVRAALRLITKQGGGAPMAIDQIVNTDVNGTTQTVFDILKLKHPEGKPVMVSAIDGSAAPTEEPHPVIFEHITGSLIRKMVLRTEGAAGPSGMDAQGWRRLCTSFKEDSAALCNSLAKMCRRICSAYVDPDGLTAFVACRLMALDKCPGVRPIGIGEVMRRILGKAVLTTIGDEVQEAAGALQVCAGHQAGSEAAIHTMREAFEDPSMEAALLVDASNAFNTLNRKVALLNIQKRCPPLAKVLINTYRLDPQLFIDGETLLSREGTTQGDPLAMAMYAIATVPLINRLQQQVTQVWFADDATAGGKLLALRDWWDQLVECGHDYGYSANASKTWLVVKPEYLDRAKEIFAESGVQITDEGRRHLGATLGTRSFAEAFVSKKVQEWVEEIDTLSSIAQSQPHAAFAGLTHVLISKWNYLQRAIPDTGELFQPLEDAIRLNLLPTLTGKAGFTDQERALLELPARLGGLGITNASKTASLNHHNSVQLTRPLVDLIRHQVKGCPQAVRDEQARIKRHIKQNNRKSQQECANNMREELPARLTRAMEMASEKGASIWVVALPIAEHNFTLHKGSFRDALCLRYGWKPSRMPSHCVCGCNFSVEHAFSCPSGALPSIRHNDIRDLTAKLLTEVCPNVAVEPDLQPLTGEALSHRTSNYEDGARLDVSAQGFWGDRHVRAFFDVRVFNPLAPSNCKTSLNATYRRHENVKKRSYEQRVREVEHGSFTPLVFSASGGMAPAATATFKRLASLISEKQQQDYNKTIAWIRCLLSFSLVRSSVMCLRGARSSYHRPTRPEHDTPLDVALSEGHIPTH